MCTQDISSPVLRDWRLVQLCSPSVRPHNICTTSLSNIVNRITPRVAGEAPEAFGRLRTSASKFPLPPPPYQRPISTFSKEAHAWRKEQGACRGLSWSQRTAHIPHQRSKIPSPTVTRSPSGHRKPTGIPFCTKPLPLAIAV
ncbi:uncharacterized protein P884DRAFT_262032 [Thermothelomyces heterothallicus CBS 202.75]|uniref:uncharacterized protein n=1 Tax=Thermothelomyces heterothallicus CBS 202.75 TaxID=1149848 RepID=UPI003743C9C1